MSGLLPSRSVLRASVTLLTYFEALRGSLPAGGPYPGRLGGSPE